MGDSITVPYAPGQAPQDQAPPAAAAAPASAAPPPQTQIDLPISKAASSIPEQPTETLEDMRRASWGSRVYHGVLNALGGKYDTQYIPTPNGVVKQQALNTPGQQWKKIISGALIGLSGSAEAGTTGPGGTMRGMGGGIRAGMVHNRQEDLDKENQANTQFQQGQQAAELQARQSMISQQLAESQWRVQNEKHQADAQDVATFNNNMDLLSRGGPGTELVTTLPTFKDAVTFTENNPQAHDDHAQGKYMIVPNVVDGVNKGVQVWTVTPDFMDRKIDKPTRILVNKPGEDGKSTWEWQDVEKGSATNGTILQWNQTMSTLRNQEDLKQQELKIRGQEAAAQGAASYASARDSNAKARQTDLETDYLIKTGTLPGRASDKKDQEAYWGPGGWNGFQKFTKDPSVGQANAAENMYQNFLKAYNDHKAGANTGAPGMVAFSDHIGATFGAIKGGRMNKNLIEEHLGARSLPDDFAVFMQKFVNGDPLSDNQWEAFKKTVQQTRDTNWDTVARLAKAQQRPVERIGFPDDLASKYGVEDGKNGGNQVQQIDLSKVPVVTDPTKIGATKQLAQPDGTILYANDKNEILGKSK